MSMTKQKALMQKLIKQQGNATTLALTLDVTAATIWRWKNGVTPLFGTALVAIEAIRDHPEDYAHFIEMAKPQGRPPRENK
jgi:hypothetical protein